MGIEFIPPRTGGGGGGGGISDVTGEEPIVVTSPTATTRHVALNNGPPGSFTTFPGGVMASMARRRIGWFVTLATGTPGTSHAVTTTATGALNNPGPTTTTYFTSSCRITCDSTAAINVRTGLAFTANPVFRGNVDLSGGFIFEFIFGFAAQNAASRFFCGLQTSTTLTTLAADPSALTDAVFIGMDSADTNLQVMHNDNAGTCTKVDLGANFPRPAGAALSRDVYYCMLYCLPNDGGTAQDVLYYIVRLDDTTKVASGTLSSNLPTATTLLYQQIAFGTGPTTAVAVSGVVMRHQCETTL